jgi:VWFA-related protein
MVYVLRRQFKVILAFVMLVLFAGASNAQSRPIPSPSPSPSPTPIETDPDSVRVFTEEVRLPVVAFDAYGHYDPTLDKDDVLVIEDGVIQQVTSVRHIPANVLVLVDTGGELSGLGGMSKSTFLTREVAANVISKLPEGSWVAILQSGSVPELIQTWTKDKSAALNVLRKKLSSSKRSRISESIVAATMHLKDRPEGSRHVVMITDGVDSPGSKTDRSEAVKKLIAVRATVHILSYTEFVRQKSENKTSDLSVRQMPNSSDPIRSTDPTQPPGTTRSPSFGIGIRFDPAMRKQKKAYEKEVKKSQTVLSSIADETGGKVMLPKSSEEMLSQSNDVVRAIAAEYVVTYRPKRALVDSRPGEYRRVQVQARRVGLNLQARKGYVVPTPSN